jgi:hypothetical protein
LIGQKKMESNIGNKNGSLKKILIPMLVLEVFLVVQNFKDLEEDIQPGLNNLSLN